jgi:hypothetical protein
LRRRWQPSAGTLESIAALLGDHWRGVAGHPAQPFWTTPVSWVAIRAVRAHARRAPIHHHFTTGGKLIR